MASIRLLKPLHIDVDVRTFVEAQIHEFGVDCFEAHACIRLFNSILTDLYNCNGCILCTLERQLNELVQAAVLTRNACTSMIHQTDTTEESNTNVVIRRVSGGSPDAEHLVVILYVHGPDHWFTGHRHCFIQPFSEHAGLYG